MLNSATFRRSAGAWYVPSLLIAAVGLAGCSKPVEKTQDIRPVRTLAIAPAAGQAVVELSGEGGPRYESRISFRGGGKIVARKVEVGSVVKRGRVLM